MKNLVEIKVSEYRSPVGDLVLGSIGDDLCLCDWKFRTLRQEIDNRIRSGLAAIYSTGDSDVIREAKSQLEEYFAGNRTSFDIPLLMIGTDFQKKIWELLITIPYGETRSYLELARNAGDEKSIRAVAAANGANALAIIVPCHRVVGSKGELTGYAGGLKAKKKLLNLESRKIGQGQMELFQL